MNLSTQNTLNNLQLPTISLIEKFCDATPEVKVYFAGILALYENNPTQDTINKINDVVKAQISRDDKIQWLKEELKTIPSSMFSVVQKKYIEPKVPAPIGLPRSGEFMTFLDYIPQNIKDSLLEAQAAARILSHIDNGKSDLKSTLICADTNGKIKEQKNYLNKTFATPLQRVEQLAEFLSSYKVNESDMLICKRHDDMLEDLIGKNNSMIIPQVNIALGECKKMALGALLKTADTIATMYPQSAQQISSLAFAYGADKNDLTDIKLIAQAAQNASKISVAYYGAEFVASDQTVKKGEKSFTHEEAEMFQSIINKRVKQIQPQIINSKDLTPTR